MIVAGNKEYGLSAELAQIFPDAIFASRSSGFDFSSDSDIEKFCKECTEHDKIVLASALHQFKQTLLLEKIYEQCVSINHRPHIITVGSTTDRFSTGKPWLYNAEKKALRDYSSTLAMGGVWKDRPKITYISYGTMSNNADKHPDRKCLDITTAAQYIKWIFDQPKNININEISIDPMQDEFWYD